MNICDSVITTQLNKKKLPLFSAFPHIGPLEPIIGSNDVLQWLNQDILIKQSVSSYHSISTFCSRSNQTQIFRIVV